MEEHTSSIRWKECYCTVLTEITQSLGFAGKIIDVGLVICRSGRRDSCRRLQALRRSADVGCLTAIGVWQGFATYRLFGSPRRDRCCSTPKWSRALCSGRMLGR